MEKSGNIQFQKGLCRIEAKKDGALRLKQKKPNETKMYEIAWNVNPMAINISQMKTKNKRN